MTEVAVKTAPRRSLAWPIAAVCITFVLVVGIPLGYVSIHLAAMPGKMFDSMTQSAAEVLRPKITITQEVLSSITDVRKENKLVVMTADINTDVTVTESATSWGMYWGTNTARVAVKNAKVQYVIETGTMGTSDYRYDEATHVLNVTFPHPHIDTQFVAIDPANIRTLDLRGGWALFDKDETRDHAISQLRPQVLTQGEAPHLRELADIRGLETATKLLEPLAQSLTRDNITVHVSYRD